MNFFKKFNKLDFSKKDDKKKFISLCISLVGVFLLVVGTSYAYLTFRSVGEVNTITAGTLSMSIPEESSTISIVNAMPMVDSVGLEQEKTYTFTIKNNSSIESYYEVRLENFCVVNKQVTAGDSTVTPAVCVPDKYIKVGIKKGNSDYEVVTLGTDGKIASGYMTSNNETISFELKIWLDESTPNDYSSKVENQTRTVAYLGRLDLFSRQLINEEKTYFGDATYFGYTGSYETYTASADGYYYVEAYGASGGTGQYTTLYKGANGGSASGYIYLNKGETLYVYVGGKGEDAASTNTTYSGGYNGGGEGTNTYSDVKYTSGGGGATDIRYFGTSTPSTANLVWNSSLGLNSRIMVAGGGGAGFTHTYDISLSTTGGAGGGLLALGLTPGTQNSGGGSFGVGASSDTHSGGGGGYYGGNSCGDEDVCGGGSSFISGYAGVNAISGNSTTITHSNNTAHYSGKYFIGGSMESGVNSGDGYAYIRYVGTELSKRTTILDNVRYIKDCQNGNTTNTGNHWAEIQAIYNGKNVAYGKTVTGTVIENASHSYKNLVDGIVDHTYSQANTTGLQCVTVDLGKEYDLDEIAIWHYFKDGRTVNNNVTYVSSDNKTFTEVINNTDKETSMGKRVSAYGNVETFAYTGSYQTFTATNAGNYLIEAYGASGGYGYSTSYYGGKGGYTSGTIYLDKNEELYVYVGGSGVNATSAGTEVREGGYNGGGSTIGTSSKYTGSGGGATDIRYFGNIVPSASDLVWNSTLGLNSRIMVAGGGGAGGYESSWSSTGGAGGNLIGGSGTKTSTANTYSVGAGGTQLAGGTGYASGSFGIGGTYSADYTGGGGGYYGGGAGQYTSGSGGGSSYISGYLGSIAISNSSLTNEPRTVRNDSSGVACTETSAASDITCSYHYSGKIFTSTTMTAGVNSGNGFVVITYVGS